MSAFKRLANLIQVMDPTVVVLMKSGLLSLFSWSCCVRTEPDPIAPLLASADLHVGRYASVSVHFGREKNKDM